MWWFCLFYSITFGGYLGLSSFLPLFLRDQHAVTPLMAGYITALAALVGSLVRPLGGYLADRLGGVRLLSVLLFGIGAIYGVSASSPVLGIMVFLLLMIMACLGLGNGAVFQLVPQRFRSQIGIATGVIGAVGWVRWILPADFARVAQAVGRFVRLWLWRAGAAGVYRVDLA